MPPDSGERTTLRSQRYPLDDRWADREDRALAIETNLRNSIRQDLEHMRLDPAYSIITEPDLQKTKTASRETALDGYIDARLIEVTLKNAQLSYLIDTVILSLIEHAPMPVDEFRECINRITSDNDIGSSLEKRYGGILDAYRNDRTMRELPEHLEDVFRRYADSPHFRKGELEDGAETLDWLRRGLERGEVTYDGEYWPIETRATLLKLPFADVIFAISYNAFAHYGTREDIAERKLRRQVGDYGKTAQEKRLERLRALFSHELTEADVLLDKLPHRSLIRVNNLHKDVTEITRSIRHELKHIVDQELLSERPLYRFADSRPDYTFETAFRNETAILVSECAALALSGDLLHKTIEDYYCRASETLLHIAGDDPHQIEAAARFKRDWEPLLAFLQEEDAYLRRLDMGAKIFLYHCLANSRTPKEVLRHLKNGLDYLSFKLDPST